MTAFRERPPGAPDFAPPAPDAAWYEQLAETLLRAHQPAPGRARRETAPAPSSPSDVLRLALKHTRPFCGSCYKQVDEVTVQTAAEFDGYRLLVRCHGEDAVVTIDGRTLQIAIAVPDYEQLAKLITQRVFEPPGDLAP